MNNSALTSNVSRSVEDLYNSCSSSTVLQLEYTGRFLLTTVLPTDPVREDKQHERPDL